MLENLKKILSHNIKNMIIFELVFKIISIFIFSPICVGMFNLIMKMTGYKYITYDNVISFITNPLTLIMLGILLVILTIYTVFDISSLIIMIDASLNGQDIALRDVVYLAFKKCLRIIRPGNIRLAFLVLFLIPFLNIGIAPSFISSIQVPEFITEYINNNGYLLVIYGFLLVIFAILLLRWMYAIHYFILEDCTFKEAILKSKNLGKTGHILDLLKIVLGQVILAFIYMLCIIFGILLIMLINKLLNVLGIITSLVISVIGIFIAILFIVYVLLSTPISYILLSALFYKHKKDKNEAIKKYNYKNKITKKIKNKTWLRMKYAFIILGVLGATIYTNGVLTGRYNLNIEYIKVPEVTAHRGNSRDYPENTMMAFKGAYQAGADYIELDVQKTKDGELIVIHDYNLKRITGLDKKVCEVTFQEIENLDAGSYKDKKFKNVRIPKLEEVLKWAYNKNIKLMIELKPNDIDDDFEALVIDMINDYNYKDRVIITSGVYEVLKKVKEYDKEIKTFYILSLAYGDLTDFNCVDGFSIESLSVTKGLVDKIHRDGKELLVWTVNSNDNINKMIELNVDNIITDDIGLAKRLVSESRTNNIILKYVQLVEEFLS